MPINYHPELNVTPHLQGEEIQFFQSQISILRWMIELGRLDICINVALLSSYLTTRRQGHMEPIYCTYGYLKAHMKSTMVFDDSYINWNDSEFPFYDWREFYQDAIEHIPENAP